ncbi:copper chaperone PCu(A)C [Yoonia sp. 208BN28-4]|uniref:copper chaperone PCu(A)C n=1 Tax=Yoonia sp. 208BN28-4 TaxID=3126505 RepID=UPI0030B5436E
MRRISPILLAMMPTTLFAHDYTVGDLKVMHPVALETPVTAQSGAGYLTIMNTGETADRLLGVEADFPRVEVHDTIVENDVSRMVHQEDGLEIAPGETLTLSRGGKHVMFMGLNGDPFEVGEEIEATLIFETAGRLEIVFNVEERDGDDGMDHSQMDHGDMDHGDMEDGESEDED